jgi:hypothetical protein
VYGASPTEAAAAAENKQHNEQHVLSGNITAKRV